MKPNYTVIEHPFCGTSILAEYEDGRTLSIPCDPANSDYQAYQATLASELSNPSTPQAGA
jgi:hypothetical protein